MSNFDRRKHWENLYKSTDTSTKSWYQTTPEIALSFFEDKKIPHSSRIIDIGGGDTFLIDHLLERGYHHLTLLDISPTALQNTKRRLGERANKINFVSSDIVHFHPKESYDVWHDRATFHFLTQEDEIDKYIDIATQAVRPGGWMILGTFSMQGPDQCSGIPIRKYSKESLSKLFLPEFDIIQCQYYDHQTPGGSLQNFVFCFFKRK